VLWDLIVGGGGRVTQGLAEVEIPGVKYTCIRPKKTPLVLTSAGAIQLLIRTNHFLNIIPPCTDATDMKIS
jgi:hypothetical protein